MTEPTPRTQLTELPDVIAGVASAVDGVVRLEPSLKNSLGQLMVRTARTVIPAGPQAPAAGAAGILITSRKTTTNVTIELTVDSEHRVVDVLEAVQRAVVDSLDSHGHDPGIISIVALDIETSTAPPVPEENR